MPERLFLAVDQGTHATRATVFDGRGRRVCSASRTVAIDRDRTGRVEQDPMDIVTSVRAAIGQALDGLGKVTIAAAGLATQRSTMVCWRASNGHPLTPAISWQDIRGKNTVDRLRNDRFEERIREITGLRLSPHYGASKLTWCLDHIRAVNRAAEAGDLCCSPLSSFLMSALTGCDPTVDPSNAGRMLLYDYRAGDWSDELLEAFGARRTWLPRCVGNREDFGRMVVGERSFRFRVCSGDQSTVPFVDGTPVEGGIYVNLGTGAFIQQVRPGKLATDPGLLNSVIWRDGPEVTLVAEGTVNGAGAALDRHLPAGASLVELDDWWAACPDPPLFLNGVGGLGSPYWCAEFESEFVGAGGARERAVAVAESILFLIRANLDCMDPAGPIFVGGGLSASRMICRRLASLLGKTLFRFTDRELTSRGLANRVAGDPADWQAGARETIKPVRERTLEDRYMRWSEAMKRHLAD